MIINRSNFPTVSTIINVASYFENDDAANSIVLASNSCLHPGSKAAHPANFSNNIEKFFTESRDSQEAKMNLVNAYRRDYEIYHA